MTAGKITRSGCGKMTGNDRESRTQRRKSSGTGGAGSAAENPKMAAQSQGIKQLMAAEKEAAQVVANARKSEWGGFCAVDRTLWIELATCDMHARICIYMYAAWVAC